MEHQRRSELIEQYKQGHNEVIKALEGFPAAFLEQRPAPGKWSAAEIVHHLADNEMISAIRLRWLLTQDQPVIQGYDQDFFALRFEYNSRPIEPALRAFEAARATTAQLLDRMTEQDWQRSGEHTESGHYTAEKWLEIYAVHAHNHAQQIAAIKSKVKTPA